MQSWGLTDPGCVRTQNQDTYQIEKLDRSTLLCVICDGMGGAKSGNVASRIAVEVFCDEIKRTCRNSMKQDRIDAMLLDAMELANKAVFEQSQLSEDFKGMGTTLVAAFFQKNTVTVINVGDSRAYLCTMEGIRGVTVDHSVVEMMVRRGEITREQAKSHPGKNLITRAVGTEPDVESDLYHLQIEKGDAVVLCSDGLSNTMSDQEILFEVVHGMNRQDCCQRLVRISNYRGSPDNVTVVLVSY